MPREMVERFRQWGFGSNAPLMLRVPRGVAVVVVASAVGLLVLSYWVGYAQGVDSGEAYVRQQLEQQRQASNRLPLDAYNGMAPSEGGKDQSFFATETTDDEVSPTGRGAATPDGSDGAGSGGGAGISGSEARAAGLNYFVLVTWPKLSAQQLADFFRERGVATMLEKTDDTRFRVWVVSYGFESPTSQRCKQYKQQLVEEVQAWNRQSGPGQYVNTDLTMRLYSPDDAG